MAGAGLDVQIAEEGATPAVRPTAVVPGPAMRDGVPGGLWAACVQVLRWGGAGLLLLGCVAFVALSSHWRVVNDAALMHYVVLLQEHGMAPYRMVQDINWPGAYLPDSVAMEVAGGGRAGDIAWRVYDGLLLLGAAGAMVVIAWPVDWFAGVFAGALLALFHGRDGIGQAGQRDLLMAVLFLLATACWEVALRERAARQGGQTRPWGAAGWWGALGLALGAATTVKPFGAVLFCVLVGWGAVVLRGRGARLARPMGAAAAGFLMPVAVTGVFLVHAHALGAFADLCRVTLPFHASVPREHWWAMARGTPLSFLKLGGVALVLMGVRGGWRLRERQVVLAGMLVGLLCFLLQGKGYGYQRYPYMVFLMLWVGMECAAALRDRRWALRALGAAGLLFGICLTAPTYLRAAYRASWQEPYLRAMEGDLRQVAGPAGVRSLDGQVQCLDSISGCVNVLYRLGLVQATGTLYDEFLFPPASAGAGTPEAVRVGQEQFWAEMMARPPRVFVVTSWLFPEGPGEYAKLGRWPVFAEYLGEHYRLVDEQRFPKSENGPMGFRVYVRAR